MRIHWRHLAGLIGPLLAGVSPAALAFNISARSDNILYDDAFLKQRVEAIAAEVGHSIPDDPRIRVKIYSRGLESRVEGALIYLHRVQLTKAFSGLPPYPFAGYLPLRSTERYGIDDEDGMDRKLEEAIRAFFVMMKEVPSGLDPDPAAPEAPATDAADDEAAAIAGPDAPTDFSMGDVGDGKAPPPADGTAPVAPAAPVEPGAAPDAVPAAPSGPDAGASAAPLPPPVQFTSDAPPPSTEEGAWAPAEASGIPASAVTGDP